TSVSTDRHAAPWAAYEVAISAGLKLSRMTPLEGDAFLISAMTPALPLEMRSSSERAKPRTSLRLLASRSTSDSLRICLAVATSIFFVSRILARMSFMQRPFPCDDGILQVCHGPHRCAGIHRR